MSVRSLRRKVIVLVVVLTVMLALTTSTLLGFKVSTIYTLMYDVEVEVENQTTVNIPLPPKLLWQSVVAISDEQITGGYVEKDYDKGILHVVTGEKLYYKAQIELMVKGIYNEGYVLEKLRRPLKEFLNEYFGLKPSTYHKLTSSTYWWNYTSEEVKNALNEFRIKYNYSSIDSLYNDTLIDVLMNLRDYVSKKLTYKPVSKGRLGVREALIGSYGDCSEYSDLFITLSRALGIPSLRCIGYVVKEWDSQLGRYKIIGHAWPIIYVNNLKWIPFEVTVAPEYLEAKPGEISLKYVCLLIDHGNLTRETLNLSRDVLYDPSEKWVPGSSASLIIDSVKVRFQLAVRPKAEIRVSEYGISYEKVFISIFFFTLVIIMYIFAIMTTALKVRIV